MNSSVVLSNHLSKAQAEPKFGTRENYLGDFNDPRSTKNEYSHHPVAWSKSCRYTVSAKSACIARYEKFLKTKCGIGTTHKCGDITRTPCIVHILLYLPCCRNAGGPRYIYRRNADPRIIV